MESFKDLKGFYQDHFSLGYLNCDFNSKATLIALICYVTNKMKEKSPNVTHYQVIRKLADLSIPESFIIGLAIICEDWSYGVTEFPTFGIESKKIPSKIKELLNTYVPF